MPLPGIVVEDGTGMANANALASVDDANVYHEGHPDRSAWESIEDPTKEARLMMASSIAARRVRWVGSLLRLTQGMPWPRIGVVDSDGRAIPATSVPAAIRDGVCELARLLADREVVNGSARLVLSESVGPISYSYGDRRAPSDRFGIPASVLAHWGDFVDYSRQLVRA